MTTTLSLQSTAGCATDDHWSRHARQWNHVGQPLRPGPDDVAVAARMVGQTWRRSGARRLRALLLGVTPELAAMTWPTATQLLAVDRCPGMIGGVLPETGAETMSGVCGNWLRLPVADERIDCVVGDGCLTVLETVDAYRQLATEVGRVLAPAGCLVLRLFVRPVVPESISTVFADLLGGRIGNFHIFKWRLAMALHPDLDQGVPVHDVWQCWNEAGIEPAALAGRLGWPQAEIETIGAYRDASARYTFPTLEEARRVLAADFEELACHVPAYELGERCPTLLLCKRP